MSTEIEATPAVIKTDVSDQLKNMLNIINEQSAQLKMFANTVRSVIKEVDRQSKDLEKLRNKKTRVKVERSPDALPSGITKPVAISDELAKFLGVAPGTLVPRNEVTKGVSGFVKSNNLSDPENKQKFILDDRAPAKALKVLLGNPTEAVTYFNLQRYLKHHYIIDPNAPVAPPKKVVSKKAEPVPEVVVKVEPVAVEPEKKKKKIVVVKKKSEGLTEEV